MKLTYSEQILVFIIGILVEVIGTQVYLNEPFAGIIVILFAGIIIGVFLGCDTRQTNR
jgi:TM2 domain-containing membrane protein YozV